MTLGAGTIINDSSAQKLVTRSSTEAEVVGVHDELPKVLWTALFLQEQGFAADESIVYQDNMSAMLLEKNGRASSSKRTRHMNIRYFHIKDRVDSGDILIEHCPTEEMIADFFTKPLQGGQFYRLRDYIMNIDPSSPYHSSHRSVLKYSPVADNCPASNEGNLAEKFPLPDSRACSRACGSYKDALLGNAHAHSTGFT